MTRKQVRNQVRRHLGGQSACYKVRAYRYAGRCMVTVTHRGTPQASGERGYCAIARDWSHAARQAQCGLWVMP